jgi:two-component system, chemotaxis family, response regulator WspF
LDHLVVEAEAVGSVELTRKSLRLSIILNYSGRAQFAPDRSSISPSMRIGIANDMGLAREALRRVVLSSPANEVAWMAKDGAEAVALARADAPDLILMDLFMPGTDGVEATRRIMGESPCAILVVTATITGHLSKVYQAMGYGALDAIDTPTLGPRGEITGAALLLHKIELIGKLLGKPVTKPVEWPDPVANPSSGTRSSRAETALDPLVILGASTGGPQALAVVLSQLPATFATCIVIVQHVDAAFAPGLGQWLSEQAGRRVLLAAEGHRPAAGEILLSGTDHHLVVGEDYRLHYSAEPKESSYHPSVDVFFNSVARNWPRPGVAVLLTGMLRDGAQGLLQLRRGGWRTIAQDESSSVVWGMPKAAVEIGAAEEVVSLLLIAEAIVRLLPR